MQCRLQHCMLVGALVFSVLLSSAAQGSDAEPSPDALVVLQGLNDLAPHTNESCMLTWSCCKGSSATISELLWHHIKAFAPNYHIRELLDSTPRMLERYYTFYNLYANMKAMGTMQVYAADCYFGVVGILLNALPAIEFEEGLEAAQQIFVTAVEMLDRNNDTDSANWTIPRDPLVSQFPVYLGLVPNDCGGSKLRVFVYETEKYSRGSIFCSAGQWGVEVFLHRFFASSSCRTFNPDEADFFFVPDYRACHLHLAPNKLHKGLTRIEGDDFHSKIIRNHHEKYRQPARAEELFKELVGSLEHFACHSVQTLDGQKHLIDVEDSESIPALKAKIQSKFGSPPEQQQLSFAGRLLNEAQFRYPSFLQQAAQSGCEEQSLSAADRDAQRQARLAGMLCTTVGADGSTANERLAVLKRQVLQQEEANEDQESRCDTYAKRTGEVIHRAEKLNDVTLAEFNIQDKSTVQLITRGKDSGLPTQRQVASRLFRRLERAHAKRCFLERALAEYERRLFADEQRLFGDEQRLFAVAARGGA
ncbi:unnamed protein product [Polarella glacialis]|uniref:Ubiquitin-like domain-containing protein n=1 Tax=Polarella glacialis TaxID=89957 RepID=A0A813FNW8_POLGL|nr:unnamed protein product [Polarella glacialis]